MGSAADQIKKRKAWRIYWARFIQSGGANLWAFRILAVLAVIAILGNFLANDKPLYCKLDGQTYFPVFREIGVKTGLQTWPDGMGAINWYEQDYQRVLWPLIPYKYSTLDTRNMNFRSPTGPQQIPSPGFRHWLGTDQVGRDVAAGMIQGLRSAFLVGLGAMGIACLIGLLLGLAAGYFSDDGLDFTLRWWFLQMVALSAALWWIWSPGLDPWRSAPGLALPWEKLLLPILFFGLAHLGTAWLPSSGFLARKVPFPVDSLVIRLIEITNSIPTLFLLLAGLAVFPSSSLVHVSLLIGLLSWTGIARFARAETLRIREEPYIDAARILGFSKRRILLRHILPNALPPVFIALAFGFSGAILLEAYLSFLGVGPSPDEVTWGSMLQQARNRVDAWWLALFPGSAIFLCIACFTIIGEGLSAASGTEK